MTTLLTLDVTLVLFIAAVPPVAIPNAENGIPGVSAVSRITPPPGTTVLTVASVSLSIKVAIATATV